MSASDNLHPKLFHGSRSFIKNGDTIKPGFDVWNDTPGAYASTSYDGAEWYAEMWDDPDLKTHPDAQRPLFHPIYEVEHETEHSDPSGRLQRAAPDYRRDEKGFRVKGLAGWSIGNISVGGKTPL